MESIAQGVLAAYVVFHIVFIKRLGEALAHLAVGESQSELLGEGVVLLQREIAALEQHGYGVGDALCWGPRHSPCPVSALSPYQFAFITVLLGNAGEGARVPKVCCKITKNIRNGNDSGENLLKLIVGMRGDALAGS